MGKEERTAIDKAIKLMMRMQVQVKVLHWQTTSYAEHMAFGGFYDFLDGVIDKFVEIWQGKGQRIKFEDGGGSVIKILNYDEVDKEAACDGFIKILKSLTEHLDASADSDLLNLRDEILGETNKLKYLLTF